MKLVWLASYPRSGNTLLRIILQQCFGLRSASIYPNDLGGNSSLEEYVGHIEQGPDGNIRFDEGSIPLIKTHEHPSDEQPAIYVIRDGRAASVSLWKFYSNNFPVSLNDVIEGHHPFGTWSSHVQAWNPCNRPGTLLLRYEDMNTDLPAVLGKISIFLKRDIIKERIPDRNTIANVDKRWVKRISDWRTEIPEDNLKRLTEINEEMLRNMGYM